MATKDKPSIHPEVLKMYNSPNYRKKVKRIITAIKDHHGISGKIKKDFPKLSPKATDKQRDAHNKQYANKPVVATAHYFAQNIVTHQERRLSRPSE